MTESKVTELEQSVLPYTDGFLSGDKNAIDKVWGLVYRPLVWRAAQNGLAYDIAREVTIDAMMYVMQRGKDAKHKLRSLMAALNQSVDWHSSKAKYEYGREEMTVLSSDIEFANEDDYSGDEDDDEDGNSPLEQLEALRIQEGWDPSVYVGAFGQYMSSIVTETPEDIVTGQNMRTRLESMAVEACGQKAWDIYYAVVVNEDSQSEVAERCGLSQQRVSQVVQEVGVALKARLMQG